MLLSVATATAPLLAITSLLLLLGRGSIIEASTVPPPPSWSPSGSVFPSGLPSVQPIVTTTGGDDGVVTSKAWRIRNAVPSSTNAWALRGLKFCLDFPECNHAATGQPFDSGNSPDWGPPSSLFDDDVDPTFSNFWKNFDGSQAGKAYVGLILDDPTSVITGVAIRPDNVVYGIDIVYLEFWIGDDDHDEVEVDGKSNDLWETYMVLYDVPKHYGNVPQGYWVADIHNYMPSSAPSSVPSTAPSISPSSPPSESSSPSEKPSLQPVAIPSGLVTSKAWRIRNAVPGSSNAWALRGLKFCLDIDCNHAATGYPFDSGNSPDWGAPDSLFDDDVDPTFSNFWKNFDGSQAGKSYVGLELDDPTSVITAVAIRPDNVVYGIDTVYLEFWIGDNDYKIGIDGDADEFWETYMILYDVPKHYGDVQGYWVVDIQNYMPSSSPSAIPSFSPSSPPSDKPSLQPVAIPSGFIASKAWRIRNAVPSTSNAWALRGLQFCLDPICNLTAIGEPFDSGNSPDWGPPSALFDDETDPNFTNFWKSFDGNKAGKSYVGLVLDDPTDLIAAIGIRPDNVVYGIDTVYLEFWNGSDGMDVDGESQGSWEVFTVLYNIPKHYGDVSGYWSGDVSSYLIADLGALMPSSAPSAMPSLRPSSSPSGFPSKAPTTFPSEEATQDYESDDDDDDAFSGASPQYYLSVLFLSFCVSWHLV